jgi:hypothetical protein
LKDITVIGSRACCATESQGPKTRRKKRTPAQERRAALDVVTGGII